jgi:Zn-dependent peptidase ImmA (M78 family)
MFKRGFKTYCEQTAEAVRRQRRLSIWEPLPAKVIATELRARLVTPRELPTLPAEVCERLLSEHSNVWSALTISAVPPVIVYNPMHVPARQNSDLMHEIAHLLLEHVPSKVYIDPKTRIALRHHDKDQEDQANWLAACLLLPRAALLRIKQLQISDADACEIYLVSPNMLRFRFGSSGVNIQYQRRKRYSR